MKRRKSKDVSINESRSDHGSIHPAIPFTIFVFFVAMGCTLLNHVMDFSDNDSTAIKQENIEEILEMKIYEYDGIEFLQ